MFPSVVTPSYISSADHVRCDNMAEDFSGLARPPSDSNLITSSVRQGQPRKRRHSDSTLLSTLFTDSDTHIRKLQLLSAQHVWRQRVAAPLRVKERALLIIRPLARLDRTKLARQAVQLVLTSVRILSVSLYTTARRKLAAFGFPWETSPCVDRRRLEEMDRSQRTTTANSSEITRLD